MTLLTAVLAGVVSLSFGADERDGLRGFENGRVRVAISSDIGGTDPDDYQSFVHFLVYANHFDTEALISSPLPSRPGRTSAFNDAIAHYAKDFSNLNRFSTSQFPYPRPDELRAVVKQGAIVSKSHSDFAPLSAGARLLIEAAKEEDPRPLYVLVWGGMRDVAIALRNAPEIKSKIRVYSIGSWNTQTDPAARKYIADKHKDLWWIENNTTFRGMYKGGKQSGDLGNTSFLSNHVKGHGALGNFLVSKKKDIKMGDTPSLLWLLDGCETDLARTCWGGQFRRPEAARRYWTDRKDQPVEGYAGAWSVAAWREKYLRHWQKRMDRLR